MRPYATHAQCHAGHQDLQAWIKLHCDCHEYQFSISKRCWEWDVSTEQWKQATECKACRKPKMPPHLFKTLSQRTPLNPLPEPTRAASDEWAKYEELALKGSTSDEYRPSLMRFKKRKGDGQKDVDASYVRTHYTCSNCRRVRLVFGTSAFSEQHQELWCSAMADNAHCGVLPLPPSHKLTQELGLQVKENITCNDLMERAYFGRVPKSAFPQPWLLLCFHCSSSKDVKIDEQLAEKHTTVRPQCADCRNRKVPPITEGKTKKCSKAPDARLKAAADAEALAVTRKTARLPVPPRKKGYLVERVVGKAKQGKMRKVFWKEEDTGVLCGQDECTWQGPTTFVGGSGALVASEIVGKTLRIEEGGTVFEAKVEKVHDCNSNSFYVVYTKKSDSGKPTKKKARFVDFELPTSEKTSWWRLDGYVTEPEVGQGHTASDEEQEDEEGEEEEEGDMQVDSE